MWAKEQGRRGRRLEEAERRQRQEIQRVAKKKVHSRWRERGNSSSLTLSNHLDILLLCGAVVAVSPEDVLTLTQVQLKELSWGRGEEREKKEKEGVGERRK